MNRPVRNPAHTDQRGAAIMVMLLILILGAASFLLTKLGKGDARQPDNLAAATEIGAVIGALIGYATITGNCLPCPDTDTPPDGVADLACGTGAPVAGTLPWITLGIGALDSWGHRLRYVVDPDFAGSGACAITQSMQSDLVMKTRNSADVLVDLFTLPADYPPAVVIAHGANGYGAVNEGGTIMPNPPASHVDEDINRSATTNLVQRTASDTASAAVGGPFDDLVNYVNMTTYKTRLGSVAPLPP